MAHELSTVSIEAGRRAAVSRLLQRMVSPLCGLDESVSFSLRGRHDPRFVVAGAQLTGVHRLLGLDQAGSYHIGGTGTLRDEALIRTLGETVERYSQLVAPVSGHYETRRAPAASLRDSGQHVLPATPYEPFASEQYARSDFPFASLSIDQPIDWVRAWSVFDVGPAWIPSQLAFVGYQVAEHEPWIGASVTTGCAAHTDRWKAVHNALMELVVVDAAMGHWYSAAPAQRIVLDARTASLNALMERHVAGSSYDPCFFLLPSPGFDTFVVACLFRARDRATPLVALGLGGDGVLERAMYKALVEAVATVQLGKMLAISPQLIGAAIPSTGVDPARIYDFDGNVAYYGEATAAMIVLSRFDGESAVRAHDLAPDRDLDPAQAVREALAWFGEQRMDLVALDCTTVDARQLGFVAYRLWSPDTIGLCPPSAPPLAHERFLAYGGAERADPHPYP